MYWQRLRLLKGELLCFEEQSCSPRRYKISPNTGKLRWWSRRIVHSLSPSLKEPGGRQDQDPDKTFKGCTSLTKAVFRYQWPGFQRAMLAWEYEIIQPSEGILIGQLSRVFHELQCLRLTLYPMSQCGFLVEALMSPEMDQMLREAELFQWNLHFFFWQLLDAS